MSSIRDEVMSLPADERLPYALRMLDELMDGDIMAQSWLMENMGLTLTEAKLFYLLNKNSPRVVPNGTIVNSLWPHGDIDASMIKVLICKLRNKGLSIKTQWSVGYSVEHKIEIGAPSEVVPVNRGRPWTDDHDADLITMVRSGSSLGSISYELDRSVRGVKDRIRELKNAGRM